MGPIQSLHLFHRGHFIYAPIMPALSDTVLEWPTASLPKIEFPECSTLNFKAWTVPGKMEQVDPLLVPLSSAHSWWPWWMVYYLGFPMKHNFLMRLSIIYPFYHAYLSEPFDPLAFTVFHQNSGISTLFYMGHCFFQTYRSHSGSKLTPSLSTSAGVRSYILKDCPNFLTSLMFQTLDQAPSKSSQIESAPTGPTGACC